MMMVQRHSPSKKRKLSRESADSSDDESTGGSKSISCIAFPPPGKLETDGEGISSTRDVAKRTEAWMRAPSATVKGLTNLQALYKELDEGDGYATIPRAILFDDPLGLVDPRNPDLEYNKIFQDYTHTRTADGEVTVTNSGDGKRTQADLNPVRSASFRQANDVIRVVLEKLFPGRRMKNLVALRSAPGCQVRLAAELS